MNDILVKLEIKDAALSTEYVNIIRAVSDLHIMRPDDTRRVDLLIFELGPAIENDFQLIESLLSINMVGEVFLTAKGSDPDVLLRAIKIGAKEFLTQPFQAEQVQLALENFKKRRQEITPQQEMHKFGRIISVLGGKGGVGTTTVAVNLAVELAQNRYKYSVALIDMNFLFGEIPLFLEIKSKYHMGEIAKHISRLDPTFLMDILSKHQSGVYVLPSETFLDGAEKTTAKIMERVLNIMKRMFDFVVIDIGNAVSENSLKAFEMSDQVLIISVLSLPCLTNTTKLLASLNSLGYVPAERVKIIINRYLKNAEISLSDAKAAIKKDIFFTLPNDYNTTLSAINHGQPISSVAGKSEIVKSFRDLAETVIGKPENETQPEEEGQQQSKLFKWMKGLQRQ